MQLVRAGAVFLAALIVACADTPSDTETPAQAYWTLRARSEGAAFVAAYDTSAGSAIVYALPPDRRLDIDTTVSGEQVTIARFYRREGTYVCDITHLPHRCTVTDEADGTPHAQPGAPSLTRIERAPGQTIGGLPATCFWLIALSDERIRREVCFSGDGVLLLVTTSDPADGVSDRIEAVSVTAVRPDQLDPLK